MANDLRGAMICEGIQAPQHVTVVASEDGGHASCGLGVGGELVKNELRFVRAGQEVQLVQQ